jgi:NADH-quinone oxidoreductase subunit E
MKTDIRKDTKELLYPFKRQRDSLIPILQAIQQHFGYLPTETLEETAAYLNTSPSIVYGVVTFYSYFRLKPNGKNTIRLCCGTACHVRGGANILRDTEKSLGIKPGQTTPNLEYTLETVACVGACALAPVMLINDKVYGRLTTSSANKILCDCNNNGEGA